jgi:hypothetical protein
LSDSSVSTSLPVKFSILHGSGDGYLRTVCDYVHLNPLRAKLLQPEDPLGEFRWSSYPEYLKRAATAAVLAAGGSVCWANWESGGMTRRGSGVLPS